jgi:multiple sugar transport system substrate-binding protein
MRSRAIALAVVLLMAPLGARAADLVVWWDKGFYAEEDEAVRETIAAFEQGTGKQVELVIYEQAELSDKLNSALEEGQLPDFAFGININRHMSKWAFDDRLVDITEAVGRFSDLFDPDALAWFMLFDQKTGQRAVYALPMGRTTNHVHVWKSLLEQAAFTLDDIPQEWDAFWSFWCDEVQPALRRATGRDDIWGVGRPISAEAGDTTFQFFQFIYAYHADYVTRDGKLVIDDPEIRRRLVKAIDSYTAVYRKGCTPPDSVSWDDRGNNRAFLAQTVVMTTNNSLSIPQRAQGRASETLLREQRDNRMAAGPGRRGFSDPQRVLCRGGVQGRSQRRDREGVRTLSRGRGLARALPRLRWRAHAAAHAEAARGAVLARSERPSPYGRGDADRVAAHAVRVHPGLGRLAPRPGLAGAGLG